MSFDSLNLHPNLLKGIHDLGYTRPTPVQQEAIPAIMKGSDVIASAQTGTGKTAAFVLPILHKLLLDPTKKRSMRALIVSPTRELALQSIDQVKNLSRHVHLRGHSVFGGVPMSPQTRALQQGVEIISATPGRLLDHVYQGHADFADLEVFVLDEADRMMDMGFLPDIRKIISFLPTKRQNLIFSATMPEEIMKLARTMCHNPVTVKVGVQSRTPVGIRHAIYPVAHDQKTELLMRLLSEAGTAMSSVIIFTKTKSRADRLFVNLERAGIKTSVIHGDKSQNQRMAALDKFKYGRSQVLVATDVAARGIDVKNVSHVINFDVPDAPEDYIHRIGRTARAEATGDAFSLVSPDEEESIRGIEKVINERLPRVVLPDFNYRKGAPQSPRGGGGGHKRGFKRHGGGGHQRHGGGGNQSHGGGQRHGGNRQRHGGHSH